MPFLTLQQLEETAREKAEEIISLFRQSRESALEAGILYGTLAKGGPPPPGEPTKFVLLLLDRQRGVAPGGADASGRATLLAEAGAVPFDSYSSFSVPGVLQIQIEHPSDFDRAIKTLHPTVASIATNHEILYSRSHGQRAALEARLMAARRKLHQQRTA